MRDIDEKLIFSVSFINLIILLCNMLKFPVKSASQNTLFYLNNCD